MNSKSKLAIVLFGVVLLAAATLAIKQKINPTSSNNAIFNSEQMDADFDKKLDQAWQQMNNMNALTVANSNENVNTNTNTNKVKKSADTDITSKFGLELYSGSNVSKELQSYPEQKITIASLTTTDSPDKVIEYYKQQLGDQVKEIQDANTQAVNHTETSLILFSKDGGEGELSVKIWRDQDKTNIDLSISDNFIDPRK